MKGVAKKFWIISLYDGQNSMILSVVGGNFHIF